jgi:hypothetical protein
MTADIVIMMQVYERFCKDFEKAYIELNKPEKK